MLGIETKLTTYVARHSWATQARRSGAPMAVISEGLGHTSEETTRIYLQKFVKVSSIRSMNSYPSCDNRVFFEFSARKNTVNGTKNKIYCYICLNTTLF